MRRRRRKSGPRWIVMGAAVLVMGALVGLTVSLLAPSPTPSPPRPSVPVVKAIPKPLEETPSFLKAEEEAAKATVEVRLAPAPSDRPTQAPEPASPPDASVAPPPQQGILTPPPGSLPVAPVPPAAPAASPSKPPPPQTKAKPTPTPRGSAPLAPAASKAREAFAYTLHVESFRAQHAAQKRVQSLKEAGLDAFTRQADVPGKGKYYRVFIGRFPDRPRALAARQKLLGRHGLPGVRVVSASEMDR